MKIFPPIPEIGDQEGFTPDKDIFQRAYFGEGLANLMSSVEDPLVIALDAPWGSGKTIFVKMWASHLRKQGFKVIYFDAFANDYVEDAFVAIAGEVVRLSTELEKSNTPAHKRFLKRAARVGSILLRTGTKVGVKAATLGAIDAAELGALKSVATDVAKEASTKADEYLESLLKLQSQQKETVSGLRDSLSELAQTLSMDTPGQDENRPLIFIIDELDRCRPNFALELLEQIKHIFSIPKVHFLLVTHLQQLENSVRYTYGNDIDARMYLQKFYNVIIQLPEQDGYRSDRNIPKYFRYLTSHMQLGSDDLNTLQHIAEARRLSFRTIERIVTLYTMTRLFTPNNYLWLDPIISGLCAMKITNQELIREVRTGTLSFGAVNNALGFDGWPKDSGDAEFVASWWKYCLADNEADFPEVDWRGYQNSLNRYSIRDRKSIVRFMADHIERLQLPKK